MNGMKTCAPISEKTCGGKTTDIHAFGCRPLAAIRLSHDDSSVPDSVPNAVPGNPAWWRALTAVAIDSDAAAALATIALVDDDRNILTSVSLALQAEGFATRVYADGAAGLKACLENPPDLVVADIKMPRMDGLEMMRRLHEQSDLPVILLTSKDTEIDEALGLAMGADDYIGKPFSQRLLIERIRAVLRRTASRQGGSDDVDDADAMEGIHHGKLEMDPARHRVRWDGANVALTVTEFLILDALAQRPGFVKSRDQLMDVAYGHDNYVDDRTIDSHIKRLRKKFRGVDPKFKAIETLYGVGYRFDPEG